MATPLKQVQLKPLDESAYTSADRAGKAELLEEKQLDLQIYYENIDFGIPSGDVDYLINPPPGPGADYPAAPDVEPALEDLPSTGSLEPIHQALARAIENVKFERWRRDRLRNAGKEFIYQNLATIDVLFQEPPSTQRTREPYIRYILTVEQTLSAYRRNIINLRVAGGNMTREIEFATFITQAWPLSTQEQNDLEETSSAQGNADTQLRQVVQKVAAIVAVVRRWRASPITVIEVPQGFFVTRPAPRSAPPEVSTTTPTTTAPSSQQPQQGEEEDDSETQDFPLPGSEAMASQIRSLQEQLRAANALAERQRREADETKAARDNFERLYIDTLTEKGVSDKVLANTEDELRTAVQDKKRLNDEIARLQDEALRPGAGGGGEFALVANQLRETKAELKALKDQMIWTITLNERTKVIKTEPSATRTFRDVLEAGDGYSVVLTERLLALTNEYNKLITQKQALRGQALGRAMYYEALSGSAYQQGAVRLRVKVHDASDAIVGEFEIARLRPQSDRDGVRRLTANLNDAATQVTYSGPYYTNVIPARGHLSVSVSELGVQRGTSRDITYDSTESGARALNETDDVAVYTTSLGERSARLDMLVVTY